MAADLVVIGLGFAGLPLAQAAVAAGMDVIGYDRDERTVAGLNSGRSPVDDLTAADVRRMLAAGFRATIVPLEHSDVPPGEIEVFVGKKST